jgi:hypothetical protein
VRTAVTTRGEQVSDPLAVSPDGLHAASTALNEHANLLAAAVGSSSSPGGKASSLGAAAVSTVVAAFSQAYAVRMVDRGQSADVAASSYMADDDDGAADIGSVSV